MMMMMIIIIIIIIIIDDCRSNGHSDNFLPSFSKPLGIIDTEGIK